MSYHLLQEQPVVFGLTDEKERQPGLTEDQMRKLSINEDIVDGIYSYALALNNYSMNRVVRKQAFCIYENKSADQLRGNSEADQRLCFRYIV